jgi:hypothetical protein
MYTPRLLRIAMIIGVSESGVGSGLCSRGGCGDGGNGLVLVEACCEGVTRELDRNSFIRWLRWKGQEGAYA